MAFCDVTRLKILQLLREGEKSASDLLEKLDSGQSTLSHHMKSLVDSGVVAARKDGKWTYYSINEDGAHYAARLLRYLTTKEIPKDYIKEKRRTESVKPFTIVVDTSCDLTPSFIKEHDIQLMPIPYVLNGTEHKEGYWQDITGEEFYNALRNGGTANTSQINPDAFVSSFTKFAEKGEDVIYLILSSALSATYQSSQIALADVKDSYPDCNIFPIDSISATVVSTLLAYLAVEKRSEGSSAAETAAWLEEKKNNIFGVFTVDDLMYLHRGGRLSKLSAVGGSLLGIKPVLGINHDGSLGLKEKVRGRDAALKFLVSQMERSVTPGKVIEKLLIPHTDCEEDAQKLANMAKEKFEIRQLDIMLMGPVIGAHVGPGTVALVYEADMTREEFEKKYYG